MHLNAADTKGLAVNAQGHIGRPPRLLQDTMLPDIFRKPLIHRLAAEAELRYLLRADEYLQAPFPDGLRNDLAQDIVIFHLAGFIDGMPVFDERGPEILPTRRITEPGDAADETARFQAPLPHQRAGTLFIHAVKVKHRIRRPAGNGRDGLPLLGRGQGGFIAEPDKIHVPLHIILGRAISDGISSRRLSGFPLILAE